MAKPTCPDEEFLSLIHQHSTDSAVAKILGVSKQSVGERRRRLQSGGTKAPSFTVAELPDPEVSYEELKAQSIKRFERKHAHDRAKQWTQISFSDDRPIALVFIGDPHLDDDGCNWPLLERHTQTIISTPGMYCGSLGDNQNNWVGRLTRLYANQSTTQSQAWRLVEGWINEISSKLVFMVRGNHDLWSGGSDPLNWIMRGTLAFDQSWQAKFKLVFPGGDSMRIWTAHDFPGFSQFNSLHSNKKAHLWHGGAEIYAAGHRHEWGVQFYEDADVGQIISFIRARGYKFLDDYSEKLGHASQQFGASITCVIRPGERIDRRKTWFSDVEEAAEYLTKLRKK